MKDNQGCCGLPFQCSAKDGRCKAREEWLRAIGSIEVGSAVSYNPDLTKRREETRAERRARIRQAVFEQQAREQIQRERSRPGYDLGRTR